MPRYLKMNVFADKYGLDENMLYVMRSAGRLPKNIFVRPKPREMMVDELFFTRRQVFKKKVWLENHDNFFMLTENHSMRDLARLILKVEGLEINDKNLSTWDTFLGDRLFRLIDDSITDYKLSPMTWKFYRISRWLIQIARRYDEKRS